MRIKRPQIFPPVVQHYTEVLLLPFRVQLKRDPTQHSARATPNPTSLAAMATAFASKAGKQNWGRLESASIKAAASHRGATIDPQWDRWQHYAAVAYFHPTVRSFLFGSYHHVECDGDGVNDYLQVFRHRTLAGLSVDIAYGWNGGKPIRSYYFDVLRADVALLQPDVGVLQLELRARIDEGAHWSLADMQKVRDQLRRLFPPYFESATNGGHYPSALRLYTAGDDAPAYDSAAKAKSQEVSFTEGFANLALGFGDIPLNASSSPGAGHWRFLLAPLLDAAQLDVILPGDDRLPSFSFVALDDPRAVSEGDWVRLAYANVPGTDVLPYSRAFLKDFEQRHCYDRFWASAADSTDSPSRILNCGYAFTMVGKYSDEYFFMDAEKGALATFRQIYVRMGLIAHFQKTALLGATARLSALSWRDNSTGSLRPYNEREAQILSVYQHFIEFTHVFWFDEVSPQEQGVEMFAMWQRELRSKAIYDEVRQELKDLVEYVGAERAKAQQATVERFTRTAVVLGGLGVIAGILGMNVLPFGDGEYTGKDYFDADNWVASALAVTLALCSTGLVGWLAHRRGAHGINRRVR